MYISEHIFCCCWVKCSIDVVTSDWFVVLFKSFISLLILPTCSFHRCKWSIEIFNYYCWIVYFPLQLYHFYFMCFMAPLLTTHIFIMTTLHAEPFYHYKIPSSISNNNFCPIVYFVWCEYNDPRALLVIVYIAYLFPAFYYQPFCIFESKVYLL